VSAPRKNHIASSPLAKQLIHYYTIYLSLPVST